MRVQILKDFVKQHFTSTQLLDYALDVEKITTSKVSLCLSRQREKRKSNQCSLTRRCLPYLGRRVLYFHLRCFLSHYPVYSVVFLANRNPT